MYYNLCYVVSVLEKKRNMVTKKDILAYTVIRKVYHCVLLSQNPSGRVVQLPVFKHSIMCVVADLIWLESIQLTRIFAPI